MLFFGNLHTLSLQGMQNISGFVTKSILTSSHIISSVILFYTGSDCPDLPDKDGASVERVGDILIIRCYATQETFYLTCRDGQWLGETGECADGTV